MQKVANNVYGIYIYCISYKIFCGLNKNNDIHTQNISEIIVFVVTCPYHYSISFYKNPFHIAMMTLLNHNLVLP